MTIAHRRIICAVFIIVFLIVTPIVILYTQGYRYNFKRGRVQKTGIIIISSLPRNAQIYLNSQLVENERTPAKIQNVLPGDYEIKLAKDGYHDWQKQLPVYDNSTTFAEKIILWKNLAPVNISSEAIIDWQKAPDQKKIAAVTAEKSVAVFKLGEKEPLVFDDLNGHQQISLLGWSNTSKKILARADGDYFVFNAEFPDSKPIIINRNSYQKIKWDLKNDNVLYGQNNAGVWQIDLFKNSAKLVAAAAADDFSVVADRLFICQNGDISEQTINNDGDKKIITKINCPDCRFVDTDTGRLILLDDNSHNLFIIDPQNQKTPIKNQARAISWLDEDTLLFYNDWEIWIFDLDKKNEPELVTRFGAKIEEALWHQAGRHIIFSSGNKIQVIELDNRELRNIVTLAQAAEINNLAIDAKGEKLYFNGKYEGQEGMFELDIQ